MTIDPQRPLGYLTEDNIFPKCFKDNILYFSNGLEFA